MIKIVDTGIDEVKISLFDATAHKFAKNTAENRAYALFEKCLENKYDVAYTNEQKLVLAQRFCGVLYEYRLDNKINEEDIEEFKKDLKGIFNLANMDEDDQNQFDILSALVLNDQQYTKTRCELKNAKAIANSVTEQDLEELERF